MLARSTLHRRVANAVASTKALEEIVPKPEETLKLMLVLLLLLGVW